MLKDRLTLASKFKNLLINDEQNLCPLYVTLKLKTFEIDVVKNSIDQEKKDLIRNSKTILEVLNILKDIK